MQCWDSLQLANAETIFAGHLVELDLTRQWMPEKCFWEFFIYWYLYLEYG